MARIILSSTLVQFANNKCEFDASGDTLFSLLLNTIQKFPFLRPHLFDIHGNLTATMDFYLNDENISTKRWHSLPIKNTDVLSILFADSHRSKKRLAEELRIPIPLRNNTGESLKLV